MRIIVCLLNQTQLITLWLIQARLNTVSFFQTFQAENKELSIILIVQRRERNMYEFSRFEPMNESWIDCNCFIWSNIWTILQIIMLSFLLTLKVESCKSAQVLFADSLINSGTSSYSLSIVVWSISPPVSFCFHVAQDHVFNGSW